MNGCNVYQFLVKASFSTVAIVIDVDTAAPETALLACCLNRCLCDELSSGLLCCV